MTERCPHPFTDKKMGLREDRAPRALAGGSGQVLTADWVRRDPGAVVGKS